MASFNRGKISSRIQQTRGRIAPARRKTVQQFQAYRMLTEEPSVRKALCRIIARMEMDFHAQQDLMQEALVHLWFAERQRPAQKVSWYLQSAKFHLQHIINRGRSVDSLKHCALLISNFSANFPGREECLDCVEMDEGMMSKVLARDAMSLMEERLGKIDRIILYSLAEGLGPREIANRLQVSHVFVLRHRRKIASIAIKLGVEPPSRYQPSPRLNRKTRRRENGKLGPVAAP